MRRNAIAFIFIAFGCLTVMQCRFIVHHFAFFPDRTDLLSDRDLPDGVREIFVPTIDGEQLQCYWIHKPHSRYLLIYFHGNAGNIGHRLPDLLTLADMNLSVIGVGYRGYGRSTGKPSEAGIYTDGESVLKFAATQLGITPEHILVFGRSIGSTVAVHLAAQKNVAGTILVTPMTSGRKVGEFYGFGVLAHLAGEAFDNLSRITRIRSPLLIVHGTADDIIPLSMGRELYQAAPQPKTFAQIQDAGHNDLSTTYATPYWQAIRQWLATLGPQAG